MYSARANSTSSGGSSAQGEYWVYTGRYIKSGNSNIYYYEHYVWSKTDQKGNFISNIIAKDGTYKNNTVNGSYWYEKDDLAPKYTLQKYDSSLKLQSTYDVDTKILTTESIDISNKGNNKVKLKLNTTGTDYKTYISNDNANWQEVTDITSNTLKELNVDGWDNLFIKIETNTSRINNIDVAFYKD